MKGDQPEGTMTDSSSNDVLPGHERDSTGTLVIRYQFTGGTQGVSLQNIIVS